MTDDARPARRRRRHAAIGARVLVTGASVSGGVILASAMANAADRAAVPTAPVATVEVEAPAEPVPATTAAAEPQRIVIEVRMAPSAAAPTPVAVAPAADVAAAASSEAAAAAPVVEAAPVPAPTAAPKPVVKKPRTKATTASNGS